MNDADALLAAIRLYPDENTPRLMYADLMDEQGKAEYAEFIRVQVELANWQAAADACPVGKKSENGSEIRALCSRGNELRRRETELFNVGTNPGGFLDISPAAWGRIEWRRGFPDSLSMITAEDWLAHADAIARWPVREVTLTTWPPGNLSRGDVLKQFAEVWPGITFKLPQTFADRIVEEMTRPPERMADITFALARQYDLSLDRFRRVATRAGEPPNVIHCDCHPDANYTFRTNEHVEDRRVWVVSHTHCRSCNTLYFAVTRVVASPDNPRPGAPLASEPTPRHPPPS